MKFLHMRIFLTCLVRWGYCDEGGIQTRDPFIRSELFYSLNYLAIQKLILEY